MNTPHHSTPFSPRNPAESVAITPTNLYPVYAKMSTSWDEGAKDDVEELGARVGMLRM
jgi:hypothetical protein